MGKYTYPATEEQRQRHNEYLRTYRAAHPEKVRAWRERYILRAAARLAEQRTEQAEDGDPHARD